MHALRTHFGHTKQLDNYLHIFQHSYNKETRSSTGFSPFEVYLGFQPASPTELPLTWAPQGTFRQQQEQQSTQRFLQQIAKRHSAVTSTLKVAQEHAKQCHEKQINFTAFQLGDQVWLHLDKKRFKGNHHKLLHIRYGLYTVLDKIGENAYRLDLPPQLGIHNVINVNHLKNFEPSLMEEPVTINHVVDNIPDFQIPLIQVDIGGHPPFPNGSKQFSGHFGNLLFLAGFNFWGHFEGPYKGFSRSYAKITTPGS